MDATTPSIAAHPTSFAITMNARLLLVCTLTFALTACVTMPDHAPSASAIEASALGLDAQAAPRVAASWWEAFGDQQLDDVMRRALANNPTLAQAIAHVRVAQEISNAETSFLSPTNGFDATATREKFSGDALVPPPFAGHVHAVANTGLDLSWDLDFWGRQAALIDQSRARVAATTLDEAGARLAISGAVLRAYIELDRQYALADIAKRTAKQREEIFTITRKRVTAGLDTNVELRLASAAIPDAEVQLRQAELDRNVAVHRIAALAGEGATEYERIHRPTIDADVETELPKSLPADLLGRRTDVLAARARVDAAAHGQAAAKAAFYPDINLLAFAGTAAVGLGNLFGSESITYGAGPAIHLPLFNAGRLKAEYRAASAEIDEAVASYNASVLNAVREVSDQLSTIDTLRDQIAKQRGALEDADAAYRLARERYEGGLVTYLTVLTAESAVLRERRQRVDLVASLAIARISLQLAVGGDFEPASLPLAAATQTVLHSGNSK